MRKMLEAEVRSLVVAHLDARLRRLGLTPEDLASDLDLLRTGVIDSLGFVDLIAELESATGRRVDLEHFLDRREATTFGAVISLFTT